ncbi:MAG: hypothetical protein WKF35_12715 [Ferruginibacter sp.]
MSKIPMISGEPAGIKNNAGKNDESKQQRKICSHRSVSITCGNVKEPDDHAADDEADDDAQPKFS